VGHWFCALVASARQELSFTGDLFMTNSRLFGFVIKELKELLAPTLFAIGFNIIVLTTQLHLADGDHHGDDRAVDEESGHWRSLRLGLGMK
jgi:hypothetical protein